MAESVDILVDHVVVSEKGVTSIVINGPEEILKPLVNVIGDWFTIVQEGPIEVKHG